MKPVKKHFNSKIISVLFCSIISCCGYGAVESEANKASNEPMMVMRSSVANVGFPTNSMYRVAPNTSYLVETNPSFVGNSNWLSSAYLLNALPINPIVTQKHLGDGYYEQRLISDQVKQLTGRRFLSGYTSDEGQLRALMDNAITFGKVHKLNLGVELSVEQMDQLTSSIVWLVEKNIVLPNGQTTKALVPQLYVLMKNSELQAPTFNSLVPGKNIDMIANNTENSGVIAGSDTVKINAMHSKSSIIDKIDKDAKVTNIPNRNLQCNL